MQAEVQNSYEQIAQLPVQVKMLCAEQGIRIRPGTDLARMLDLCENVDTKIGSVGADERLKICRARRVLRSIVECAGEPEIKVPLKRIAENSLDPASPTPSSGKDAVFELEVLQYVRQRGLTARLGEPDVVVSMPFGDYFIACKTINSLNNVEGQLRSGYRQIEKYGHGCVAFNLEPQMSFEQPVRAESAADVKDKLDAELRGLYANNTGLFDRRLLAGRLDGVVLQISCFANIAESHMDLDVFTHTVYYSRSNLQDRKAYTRFDAFRMAMQGSLGHRMASSPSLNAKSGNEKS